MDMDFIQGSDLLSSISNVSVKIDYNEREDLGFFHNSVHQNQILYQNQKYAFINALPDEQPIDPECFFSKILAKVSTETNASYDENNFWIFDDDFNGISEQIQIPTPKVQPKLQPMKKRKIQKKKSSLKKKSNRKHKKGEADEIKKRQLEQIRQRNETKNIPKNYGKAIISFASKPNQEVKHITQLNFVNYEDFKKELKQVKKSICTIADLRSLWVDFKYARVMRVIGDLFLRKYSLRWIFNSKISNINAHVKYRHKLLEAIKEPDSFQYMKHS